MAFWIVAAGALVALAAIYFSADPPVLLATGEQDDSVAPRHSIELAARLERAGVPVTLKRYPGIGHIRIVTALSRWTRGSAPVLEDIARFARAVGGEAAGAQAD